MNQLIIAPPIGETPSIHITDEGEEKKKWLVGISAAITSIASEEQRDPALAIAGNIKAHVSAVEKTRKEIKEPFLQMGRAIDDAAKSHVNELESELKRLNNLIGSFEDARRREQEAQERARRAEEARLAEEQRKTQQEADRLAEEARKKAEAAAAKGKELTPAQKVKALEEQLQAEEEQEARERELRRLEEERMNARQRAEEAKPTGGALREEIDIEVTDIHALYKAMPVCVKLAPDLAMIKAMIKAGHELPGVSATKRHVFATRSR